MICLEFSNYEYFPIDFFFPKRKFSLIICQIRKASCFNTNGVCKIETKILITDLID